MTSSLVGSEMCIRDRTWPVHLERSAPNLLTPWRLHQVDGQSWARSFCACLLYTSDAADDM
eukprot:2180116-Prorocentrum_lima.AAC.1